MTPGGADEAVTVALAMLGAGDEQSDLNLSEFRRRLRRLHTDPAEAVRIDALAAEAEQDTDSEGRGILTGDGGTQANYPVTQDGNGQPAGAVSRGTSTSAGPTVRGLMLGSYLRRLREKAGITTERAAASIRGSHSKISRMEHGRVRFKVRDVADLLTLYGIGPGDEREALLNLAKEASTPAWWQKYSDILPHWVEPYFGLETAASFIREYEVQFVPGLLQTEEYARAVIRLGDLPSEKEVIRRAQARVSRQQILRRENPPKLWAVLDEGALRRFIGGPQVMKAQLRHLIKMCENPNVTLQILPFSAGAHRAMGGPFTILRYTEPGLSDVVYLEQMSSAQYLDKPTEVDAYLEVMEEIALQAEPSGKTPGILQNILAESLPSGLPVALAGSLRDVAGVPDRDLSRGC